ncbi:MAG: hypothetical protein ACWA49_16115 [Ruegeria sp.]
MQFRFLDDVTHERVRHAEEHENGNGHLGCRAIHWIDGIKFCYGRNSGM